MTDKKHNPAKIREEFGLTEQEADLVVHRAGGGGDVAEIAQKVRNDRVGPAALDDNANFGAPVEDDLPPIAPSWPGPQGTDLPPPAEQAEKLQQLADAEEAEADKPKGRR